MGRSGEGADASRMRDRSPRQILRLAWRKLIHRKVRLGVWGTKAVSSVAPGPAHGLEVEIIGPDRFHEVLGSTPYLTEEDLADFRRQDSQVVVLRDGDRIVASTWATRGDVYVHEIHRVVHVPEGEHFMCRGYVADDHRGRDLLSHILHEYASAQSPSDLVWGLIYEWNTASIRSVERTGWRRFGEEWTNFLFTRKRSGSRRYSPRAPIVCPTVEPDPSPVALILAEETYGSCIQAMRSIASTGTEVYVVAAGSAAAIYGRSRACTAALDIATSDPGAFCEEAIAWMDRKAPGSRVVVIPLSDRLLEYIHAERDRFPERFVLAAPPPDLTDALLDKETSLAIAGQAGLDVPRWVAVRDRAQAAAAMDLQLPVIVRPTAWSATGPVYFKIIVCHDADDLRRTIDRTIDDGAELIVQEYIQAPEHAVELALTWRSADGRRTAICTGRKRRQSEPEGGVMAFGEAVDLPDVRAATVAFLDSTGFTGLGGIEFIRQGGHLWFVEFNPRVEAIHFLGAEAGIDTVALAYRELASNVVPEHVPVQRRATAWVGTAWLTRVRAHRAGWFLLVADRFRFAVSPRRVRSLWSLQDPGPGLALTVRLLLHAAGRGPIRDAALPPVGVSPRP